MKNNKGQKLIIRICAAIMFLSGVVIIFSTIYPIVSYEWESVRKYPILISPLVDEETGSFEFSDIDYTRASNWSGDSEVTEFTTSDVSYYTLSVPRLEISDATVAVNGDDLSESLVQYPGTAIPGKRGNTVIFGHSILPIYYDPENYLAIFSKLPALSEGDEVFINYDGITYNYSVEHMFEVKPGDIQILEQSPGSSYVSLVTCTPPGHPLKPRRLIVRAKLIPAEDL